MSEKEKANAAVAKVEETNKELVAQQQGPLGYDDDDAEDMIIPRIKMIQTLSPERKDGDAEEGDIINSLTKEKLNGKTFIASFKFTNHIWWRPRNDGGGILCMARDGKHGEETDGTKLNCAVCRKYLFDNSKKGREAIPVCTRYINFFGFFKDERLPVILSFAKTNYNEGKKMYSLAKVTMQNMWNYGYRLDEKLIKKNANEWFIVNPVPAGETSEDDRAFGLQLFNAYRTQLQNLEFDLDESKSDSTNSRVSASTDVADSEF